MTPSSKNPLPELEEKILGFWKENQIPQQSLKAKRNKKFIFFEGPPTANAGPGFHHVIARIFKDIIPRYKFLKGFSVPRKAGWDTHGLPVELQIEKEIGTKTKSDIENFGIDKFNRKCQESVWRFKQEWDKFTERIGFWLDLDNPYITYDPAYMESVWWLLKKIWQKGLLKQSYKVVPYCARCGTPLSSHEVAQGYQDNTPDTSVYVKFKIIDSGGLPLGTARDTLKNKQVYFLVWTTTPWTLPSNMALAVGNDIQYEIWEKNGEYLIVASNRKEVVEKQGYQKRQGLELLGKDLVGLKYEPVYSHAKNIVSKTSPKEVVNAFKVYAADFVGTSEGTGIVHIAPMYGEDDFRLGKQYHLPEYHLVGPDGKFTNDVPQWQGMWVKDADPEIIEYLRNQTTKNGSLLFQTEQITHTYPFCWRCKTPLLYYAHQSWFIMMSQMREQLLKNNKQIHWEPEHLQEGRFGEWLSEVKDWALSRDRYWGTPLPIWQCEKDKSHQLTVGSLKELGERAYQPNTYYLMRHGEATSNVKGYNAGWPEKQGMVSELTEKGRKQTKQIARRLSQEKIDLIVASDMVRIKQTVEILKEQLPGVPVHFDSRLREVDFGELDYQPFVKFKNVFLAKAKAGVPLKQIFTTKSDGGESPQEVQQRVFGAILDLEKQYRAKKILVITHGLPLWMLEGKLRNLPLKQTYELGHPKNSEIRKVGSFNLPYNEKQELDLHRPYIDAIALKCPDCGEKMTRVYPVIDCWFDSGAMPYAQHYFPFAFLKNKQNPDKVNYKKLIKKSLPFPADYIAEAIDQTRGWFYTMHAIAATLELGLAYKNVVCLGHVLDEKGEKMSKSKGNIVDPWDMINKYGVDALRWYFYTINSPGEYKKFSERDLQQSASELMVVLNVLNFFKMYAPENINVNQAPQSTTVLQTWVRERMNQTVVQVDDLLDQYKIFEASRTLEVLLDDISRWYLRRSRVLFQKPESSESLNRQAAFLGYLLLDLARLMAPFTPFLAEQIWQEVVLRLKRQDPGDKWADSVHLDKWPEARLSRNAGKLFADMALVRNIAAAGLALRAQAGIKARQPLSVFYIQAKEKILSKELLLVLSDEMNVKQVEVVGEVPVSDTIKSITQENITVGLETLVSSELKAEGDDRELMRQINEGRQEQSCAPNDKVKASVPGSLIPEGFFDNSDRLLKVQTLTNSTITVVEDIKEIRIEKII